MFRKELSVVAKRYRLLAFWWGLIMFLFGFLLHSCFAGEPETVTIHYLHEVSTVVEEPIQLSTEAPIILPASTYDIEFVSSILMETGYTGIDHETAYTISNEILYQMGVYGMDQYEELPYILALYFQESAFNPLAKNPHSSASGIGQILMSLHGHKFETPSDCWIPEKNIAISFRIMHGSYDPTLEVGQRWSTVFRGYSGGNSSGYTRHVDRFARLLTPYWASSRR